MRRPFLAIVPLLLAASAANAQIVRNPQYGLAQPTAFGSLGAALLGSWSVTDGTTGSRWDFGSSTQYVASLEKRVSNGISFGIRGTTARVPLTYTDALNAVDADANVSQGFATLHVANGNTFHSVLELSAGATVYSNFRTRTSGSKVGPSSPDPDFSFAFGYGFGYAFSPAFSIDVVQDLTTTLHQKTGLNAGDDTSVRMNSTRIVARFGFGS